MFTSVVHYLEKDLYFPYWRIEIFFAQVQWKRY